MIIDNTVEFKSTPIKGTELLLGAGNNHERLITLPGQKKEWKDLVTLDVDPECNPDVLWDLHHLPLPFENESFEEIHAYDVLEHIGQQGDWKTFFAQFEELHRILKPKGKIVAATPMWDELWAWGDPGHSRVINEGTIMFLDQDNYKEVGKTAMTDYRHYYKADFKILHAQEKAGRFAFVLEKK